MHGLTLQLTMEVINTACVMVFAAFFIIRSDEQLLEVGRQTSARTRLPGVAEAAFFTALYKLGASYLTPAVRDRFHPGLAD